MELREDLEKPRMVCPKDGWVYYPRVAASACAVIIRDGKMLLVKRNRDPYKGTWTFPAGFLDYGEHPKETVIREVKEETGLDVEDIELMDVLQSVDDPREPGHLLFFYKVRVGDDEIKNGDMEENSDIEWFNISDPPEIGWVAQKQVLKQLQKG